MISSCLNQQILQQKAPKSSSLWPFPGVQSDPAGFLGCEANWRKSDSLWLSFGFSFGSVLVSWRRPLNEAELNLKTSAFMSCMTPMSFGSFNLGRFQVAKFFPWQSHWKLRPFHASKAQSFLATLMNPAVVSKFEAWENDTSLLAILFYLESYASYIFQDI